MVKVSKFDAVDYLDSEEMMAEYLTAAMEEENPDVFLAALSDVAKARGIAQLAKDTGLGRESLYKSLAPGAKPRFDTIMKITKALGVPLAVKPETASSLMLLRCRFESPSSIQSEISTICINWCIKFDFYAKQKTILSNIKTSYRFLF